MVERMILISHWLVNVSHPYHWVFFPPVELYDGATCHSVDEGLLASQLYQQFLANSSEPKLVDRDSLYEMWSSLFPGREDGNSSSLTEHMHSGSPTLKPKAGSNIEFHVDEPVLSSVGYYSRGNRISFLQWCAQCAQKVTMN